MHILFFFQSLIVVLAAVIVSFCLWLSLRIFGLKLSRASLAKVIGVQLLFGGLASLISLATKGGVGTLVDLLFSASGFVLWLVLLKRLAASRYSIGRAIGSYITGYVLTVILSLMAATAGTSLFGQVFQIEGDSMRPTLTAHQNVLVYKFDTHPGGNAVIVYRTKTNVKALGRVHGTPGQSIAIPGGHVEVEGIPQNATSYTLSTTQYYVTADNTAYGVPPRIVSSSDIIGTVGPKL